MKPYLFCIALCVIAFALMAAVTHAAFVPYTITTSKLVKTSGSGDPFGLDALGGGFGGFTVNIPDTGEGILGATDIVDLYFVIGDVTGPDTPGQVFTDEDATYLYFSCRYSGGLLAFGPTSSPHYPNLYVQQGNDAINVYLPYYEDFSAIDGLVGTLSGTALISQGSYSNPVPIPSAIWLLGSGLIGIIGVMRKFKNKQPNITIR